MPQLQGGHDGRGLGREWFLLPVAHVQAEIKKSFIERARLALPRAVPIQQLRAFPVFNQSFGCSRFAASNATRSASVGYHIAVPCARRRAGDVSHCGSSWRRCGAVRLADG